MNELMAAEDKTSHFELRQREAKAAMASDLLPMPFRNSVPNTLIAMEFANRLNMPLLAVTQSLFVIQGKPSWDGKFVISQIVRRFGQIFYCVTGTDDEKTCVAWVTHPETGEKMEGPPVSIGMAKSEGWYSKNGSKWKTMPDLMLRYRAATFFARTYLPDLLLGLQTVDEIRDIEIDNQTGEVQAVTTRGVRSVVRRLKGFSENETEIS